MPATFFYLAIMLVVIVVWFVVFKRPVYEAILLSFVILLTISGTWGNVGAYVHEAMSTSLLYSMTAFVAMSLVLTETKMLDSCIAIILALLGRITGGAGYVSVLASAFMGALSGSGPGNVMATGAITVPAMKKSGFPPELAGNIVSNASYMGNMIPPSSNIVAALGAFTALYPQREMSTGQFWIAMWGVSLWFILQRMVMVYVFCKYYRVKPLSREQIPDLRTTLKEGWQGLLLPVIILLPFVLDYLFSATLFTQRLGAAGAKALSSCMLMFIGGLAALYTCLISKDKHLVTPRALGHLFASKVKSLVPTIAVCLFGYMIGAMFADLNVAVEMEQFIIDMQFSKLGMVLFLTLLTCILGMIIPGSSLVVMFGAVFISAFASVGIDPLLGAAMLPCICGVMCGITPPLGLGMYAGMALSGADFSKTFRNNLWWVAAQFVLEVVVLMGWLPVLGL